MDIALFRMGVLLTVSLLRLAVAVPLLITARRNQLTNLYWLSAEFFGLVIAVPFAANGALNNPWIFWTFISFSEIALIIFIHRTFHRGRASPMPVMMLLAIAGLAGGLYGNAVGNFALSAWSVYPNAIWIWGWHTIVAYRDFKNISGERSTEDWVKARYQLMITYAILDCLSAVGGMLATTGLVTSISSVFIVVGLNFASAIVQILVWVMPAGFRSWLNRNQEQRLEAEARSILSALSAAMAKGTGFTEIICAFVIRSVIAKRIGVEDPQAINKHIQTMGYREWALLLDSPDLRKSIASHAGPDKDENKALKNVKQALIEGQSLFTLRAT